MSRHLYQESLTSLPLGKPVEYPNRYTPSLLEAVPRSVNRIPLGIEGNLPFNGEDLWNAYEFSWLNSKGKPNVAMLVCRVPAVSPNIIESKSFKLYLNSFNEHRFDTVEEVKSLLIKDLSEVAGSQITVDILGLNDQSLWISQLQGECIDDLDISIDQYQPNSALLSVNTEKKTEKSLISHLLKSNCLITNQPDWGSLLIRYQGAEINERSLLKYIVSFREHNEFHEQCVERIYCDIMKQCNPDKLSVLARYTRRGGLDINPFRSNFESPPKNIRLIRQ